MRFIEKLISLIGIEVVDKTIKTPSQSLLEETLKNNNNERKPILVKRYSPKNNLER